MVFCAKSKISIKTLFAVGVEEDSFNSSVRELIVANPNGKQRFRGYRASAVKCKELFRGLS
jgi:hypothetical protein